VQTYEELMENADRFNRTASLHFASPTIINLDGAETPFPVVPVLLHHYMDVWNLFSPTAIAGGGEWVGRVRLRDFKISCVMTPFGPGFQGWITLELDKGRTELEIASFNALLDFAFYSGTGLYTSRGLGQTRRVERKGRN
jgi:CRISPR/Cas system endoribonuclease Cas6 (RAMP superfamily)